jgi:hypothetical protein
MLPIRQTGSRGTDAISEPEQTRASSAIAAAGSGRCSNTSIARTRSKASSGNGRLDASPNAHESSRDCHCAARSSSGRSRPITGTPSKRSMTRLVTIPSPMPISKMRVGAVSSRYRSRAAKNPFIIRRSIGLVDPYLSYVLPVGVLPEGIVASSVVLMAVRRGAYRPAVVARRQGAGSGIRHRIQRWSDHTSSKPAIRASARPRSGCQ